VKMRIVTADFSAGPDGLRLVTGAGWTLPVYMRLSGDWSTRRADSQDSLLSWSLHAGSDPRHLTAAEGVPRLFADRSSGSNPWSQITHSNQGAALKAPTPMANCGPLLAMGPIGIRSGGSSLRPG
jgi:hypothetical protein